MTMGCHDPRLAEGTFNEEEGTAGSRFRAGRLTTVSPQGNLSEFGNKPRGRVIELALNPALEFNRNAELLVVVSFNGHSHCGD